MVVLSILGSVVGLADEKPGEVLKQAKIVEAVCKSFDDSILAVFVKGSLQSEASQNCNCSRALAIVLQFWPSELTTSRTAKQTKEKGFLNSFQDYE